MERHILFKTIADGMRLVENLQEMTTAGDTRYNGRYTPGCKKTVSYWIILDNRISVLLKVVRSSLLYTFKVYISTAVESHYTLFGTS
jgi:hypothetical protein